MIYGYARFSQLEYERDNNCLDKQLEALREHGATKIYVDEFSIVKTHRPRFEELMDELKCGDVFVITKLDIVAWTILQGADLVAYLINQGIVVNIINTGVMDNTPATDDIKKVFFSMADFEKDILFERTQEGKYKAKKNPNFKEGRPKVYDESQIEEALKLLKTNSFKEVEKITGISQSTLARAKRKKMAVEIR